MSKDYWACALEPRNHNNWAHTLKLLKPPHPRVRARQQEKPLKWEAYALKRPNTAKNKLKKKFFLKICSLIALGAHLHYILLLTVIQPRSLASSRIPSYVLTQLLLCFSWTWALPFQNAYPLMSLCPRGIFSRRTSQINLFKLKLKTNSTILIYFSPQYSSAEIHPNHKDRLKIKRWRKIFQNANQRKFM